MSIGVIFGQVAALFIIMAIGVIGKLTGIITRESGKKLSELLVYITAPAMIVASMANLKYDPSMLVNSGIVLMLSLGAHLIAILAGTLFFMRSEPYTKKIAIFATVFANTQFLGFPVIKMVFGDIGVFYASIYSVMFTLLIWTFGIALLTGKKDLRSLVKVLTNPGLLAAVVGMILFIIPYKLPLLISDPIDMVGRMTVPLAMLFIGSQLAEIKITDILAGLPVYMVALLRLIAVPLAVMGILRLIGVGGVPASVAIILAGMPTAANTAIFAEMFTGEAAFASRCVVITTLISIASLPLLITLTSL